MKMSALEGDGSTNKRDWQMREVTGGSEEEKKENEMEKDGTTLPLPQTDY